MIYFLISVFFSFISISISWLIATVFFFYSLSMKFICLSSANYSLHSFQSLSCSSISIIILLLLLINTVAFLRFYFLICCFSFFAYNNYRVLIAVVISTRLLLYHFSFVFLTYAFFLYVLIFRLISYDCLWNSYATIFLFRYP